MPEVGQSIVSGRLRSMGLHVSRERIRRCIQISDPLNTVWRWHKAPFHQPYSVPGPNSLWHIGMFSSVFMYMYAHVLNSDRMCAFLSRSNFKFV